jgi:hypothetical protein
MGYERKSIQILGGGYNALPPVDKTPITDYLLAQNWRSDALGRLVSRAGYVRQLSIAGAGIAHSAGSAGGPGAPYYVGCNSAISSPTSAVYYDGDSTAIATGFDGNRIAFASQNGYMYVMNRGNQGRHSAAGGWEAWNLAAPPASPTASSGSSPSPVSSATYTYGTYGTTIAASISAGSATVTAASMTLASGVAIVAGTQLIICDAASANCEVVTVTGITGSTFTAVFVHSYTGPGILVGQYGYLHSLTIAGVTYSFADIGYSNAQVPAVMAGICSADTNAAATYGGSGNSVVVAPIVTNTLIPISGSDGNTDANLASGGVTSLPNGSYQYYVTFMSADLTLESNPSPASDVVSVVSQPIAVTIPTADAPVDTRIGFVNIYRTGGTLGQPYRVGQIVSTAASPATAFTDSMPDLQATNNGQTMPTTNDAPPACAGMIGPFFSRLYGWSTTANVNRLFYTPIDTPQYWNTDPQVGDWVDVGLDGEEIVWCSIHTNLLIVYKERSIWMLIGDAATGSLEQVYDGLGLAGQFALAPAGQIDYFVAPNGLCLFDMSEVHVLSGNILPLFNQSITNAGNLTPPGSVLPGSAFNSTSTAAYAVALGHAMGRLYISYAEQGGDFNLLVFDEGPEPERNAYLTQQRAGRWFYERNAYNRTYSVGGFFGFFFDGTSMCGLTGVGGGKAQIFSIADFRGFLGEDQQFQPTSGSIPGNVPIECVCQSHYEDCGLPDNDKMFLEVAIDFEFATGAAADVYVSFNNGVVAAGNVGTLAAGARRTQSFGFAGTSFPGLEEAGVLARNISVLVDAATTGIAIVHNVYIYYYVEARLALVASTIPTDLGVGKVKECKELELDIDASGGTVAATIASDLPGNALSTRHSPTVAEGGRAIWRYPFAITRGLLWQLSLVGAAPFRLYSARLLMRVIGVSVESYESAAGFVWDSMQVDLGDADSKIFDQLRFEMESDGDVSVTMLTDLPGEAFSSRGTFVLATAATARAWVTVPLPPGIEGRSVQLQCVGPAGYRFFTVQARWSRIGRYLAGSTPSGNDDAFNTLEFDFESERRKMFKRIEIDMVATGTVNMSVITDQDGAALATVNGPTALTTPNGRTALLVIMPPGIRGRLMRVLLTSTAAARIYRIRVWTRNLNDPQAGWKWEDFPLETSDVLPKWSSLVIDETPPKWELVDLDFQVSDS